MFIIMFLLADDALSTRVNSKGVLKTVVLLSKSELIVFAVGIGQNLKPIWSCFGSRFLAHKKRSLNGVRII